MNKMAITTIPSPISVGEKTIVANHILTVIPRPYSTIKVEILASKVNILLPQNCTLQHVTEISDLESDKIASLLELKIESERSAGEHLADLRNFLIYCNTYFFG